MIIDLQRRLAEVGRIRIGQQVASGNGKRPAKLDTFRLTSADPRRIKTAAQLYGGTPTQWDAPAGKQWEVITTADALNVIVPPSDMAFSQFYELWSGGGCQRRCDGVTESISDGPCLCDPDKRECAIHTRLSVMLRDLPGLGVWRIDTSGYYAAVELQGAVEVVRLAAGRGQMLPAQLRLEQRMTKRPGQGTRRFAVPVLDIEVSPAQLLAGGDPLDAGTVAVEVASELPHSTRMLGRRRPDGLVDIGDGLVSSPANIVAPLTPVPETVPEQPAASVAEQAAATKTRRRGTQQTIPHTGLKPRTMAEIQHNNPPKSAEPPPVNEPQTAPEPPETDPEQITPAQLKKLAVTLREAGFDDDSTEGRKDRLAYVASLIGRDNLQSSKDLTKTEASTAIDRLTELAAANDG